MSRSQNRTPSLRVGFAVAAVMIAIGSGAGSVVSWAQAPLKHSAEAESFVHGAPIDPSEDWEIAAGGRIYDNWWDALDRKKPTSTHPSYPADAKTTGPNSWRCKECHGWDYQGRNGEYKSGVHATGIKGIRGAAGRDPAQIVKLLRAPVHGYTPEMIKDEELRRVALFVSKGQHDVNRLRNPKTGEPQGSVARGRSLYQTTCAACHGYDGKLLNWGSKEDPAFIGTDSNRFTWEVLHKIRNSHTGIAMINFRALPMSDAMAVLAYSRTLPRK